jgi:hypothetical protein
MISSFQNFVVFSYHLLHPRVLDKNRVKCTYSSHLQFSFFPFFFLLFPSPFSLPISISYFLLSTLLLLRLELELGIPQTVSSLSPHLYRWWTWQPKRMIVHPPPTQTLPWFFSHSHVIGNIWGEETTPLRTAWISCAPHLAHHSVRAGQQPGESPAS